MSISVVITLLETLNQHWEEGKHAVYYKGLGT